MQAVGVIGVVLSAIGTGIGAYAQAQAGEAADKAAKFNAKVAQNQATEAQMRAGFEAGQVRRRNLIRSGDQRAAYAKSGVDISGSANDVINDTGIQGELAALATLYGGASQAQNLRAQAQLDIFSGQQAQTAGWLGGGTTLLTGGARTAGMAYDYFGGAPKLSDKAPAGQRY